MATRPCATHGSLAFILTSLLLAGCGSTGGDGSGGGSGSGSGGGSGSGSGAAGCGAYPNALFCDDFESGQPLGVNWQATTSSEFTFPVLHQSTTAHSPSHDMLAASQAGDGGQTFCSAMHSVTPSSDAPLRLAFAFRVDVNDAIVDGVPHMLQLDAYPVSGSGGFEAQINLSNGQVNFALVDFNRADMPGYAEAAIGQYHVGEWNQVELALDFSSQSVSAVIGGQVQSPLKYVPLPADYAGAYRLDIYLIASALNGPSANTVEFDDVVLFPGS